MIACRITFSVRARFKPSFNPASNKPKTTAATGSTASHHNCALAILVALGALPTPAPSSQQMSHRAPKPVPQDTSVPNANTQRKRRADEKQGENGATHKRRSTRRQRFTANKDERQTSLTRLPKPQNQATRASSNRRRHPPTSLKPNPQHRPSTRHRTPSPPLNAQIAPDTIPLHTPPHQTTHPSIPAFPHLHPPNTHPSPPLNQPPIPHARSASAKPKSLTPSPLPPLHDPNATHLRQRPTDSDGEPAVRCKVARVPTGLAGDGDMDEAGLLGDGGFHVRRYLTRSAESTARSNPAECESGHRASEAFWGGRPRHARNFYRNCARS